MHGGVVGVKNLVLFPVRPEYLHIFTLNIKNTAFSPARIFQKLMTWYGEWSFSMIEAETRHIPFIKSEVAE